MNLRIANIVNDSIVDGPGLRLTVFVQGCVHNCEGCHNPDTHNLYGGKIVDTEYILSEFYSNPLLDGVTFSGGEPFLQQEPLSLIAEDIRANGFNVITYTGFTWEKLMEEKDKYYGLLRHTDILIDGPFIERLKSYDIMFRGSSNQRAIDVFKSFSENKVILYEF